MSEGKTRCSATSRRTGEQCGQFVIPPATVCRWHGGAAKQVKDVVNRKRAAVEAERLAIDFERDEDPAEVLLAELRSSRALAAYWEDKIARDESDVVSWIKTEDGDSYPGGLSVEAQLWQTERDRAIRVAQICLKLGLEERRVRLAERDGQEIAGMLGRVLRALGVFDDPRAPDIVRAELRRLEAASDPPTGEP